MKQKRENDKKVIAQEEKAIATADSVKLKAESVKVPSLDSKTSLRKSEAKKQPGFVSKQTSVSLQQILSLMFNLKDAEKDEKPKEHAESEQEPIKDIEEKSEPSSGGYGSAQKSYGALPESSYTDYSKLFSYLGKFRANSNMYIQGDGGNSPQASEKSFQLADIVTIETGARYVKYFSKGSDMNTTMLSMVPISGMDAAEWASFKLFAQLDQVMYRLKTTTS